MAMFLDEPPQQEPIRVFVRLRPVNKFELSRRSRNCVVASTDGENGSKKMSYAAIVEKGPSISDNEGTALQIDSPLEGGFNFEFDKVFQEETTQLEVYQHVVAPIASHVLEGFSCALIAYGQTGSGKTHTMMGGSENQSSKKTARASCDDEKAGMIHRLVKDLFRLIHESPPTVEYIVRCSFVEIYLEKVLDLLNPVNRSIQIVSGEGEESAGEGLSNEGVRLEGASEACCFDVSDVFSLLARGNACRTVSSTKMNTDSSRSHAIFILKIEQNDNMTGISKVSQLQMIDMAGSELGGGGPVVGGVKDAAVHQEAKMINKSLSLLNTVVKTVVENQKVEDSEDSAKASHVVPYRQSKLSHLLRDAFGGNIRTSVILTASPASYNISESIRTMKFGHFCRSVKNSIKPKVEMSPLDYRKILNDSQKKQGDLISLVNELSAECFQLKQDAKKQIFVESHYDGPLWKTIESILVNGASPTVIKSNRSGQGPNASDNEVALEEKLSKTRRDLENLRQKRGNMENLLAERQSEVAVLRTQNDNYASEKKKDTQELVAMRNEIRLLTQRKQEVEHNLRTSQFREYEATVFLRQFRRFYRRLLRNKAHQGTGRTSEVIERVPGVPDLNDLIDVDSLLLEAGLIEESELHDDNATGAYRPSAQALGRSTDANNKAWKEAALHGKVDELESFDRSSLEGKRLTDANAIHNTFGGADAGAGASQPHGQSISNRQQFLGTPAGRLTTMRERELERDLLRATERCIELQVALNEEKANVDILTNRPGNLNKKKFSQESIQLKQQLDKKTHDLQAIIWKMNELHLINKTYNEKMSNREQHVTYLEENLVELQSSNRNMILERQEAEGKLREELDNLKVLVDAMTVPLWQFGECGVTGRTLASRIRLPVSGGDYDESEKQTDADGAESLESLEESVGSYEEVDDDGSEYVNQIDAPEAPAPQVHVETRDGFTQTYNSCDEKGTMTDTAVTPQTPRVNSNDVNVPRTTTSVSALPLHNDYLSSKPTQLVDQKEANQKSVSTSSSIDENSAAESRLVHANMVDGANNGCNLSENYLFHGGKPAGSQPRRSVHKFGLMIRPGVMEESSSKAKSKRASRSVKSGT